MRRFLRAGLVLIPLLASGQGDARAEDGKKESGPAGGSLPAIEAALAGAVECHRKLDELIADQSDAVARVKSDLQGLCGSPQASASAPVQGLAAWGSWLGAGAALLALLVLHWRETKKKRSEYFFELMKKMEETRGARKVVRGFLNTAIGEFAGLRRLGEEEAAPRVLNEEEKQELRAALEVQQDGTKTLQDRCQAWCKVSWLLEIVLQVDSGGEDKGKKKDVTLDSKLDELGRAFDVVGLFDRQGLVSRRLVDRFYSPPLYEFIPILRVYLLRVYTSELAKRRRNLTHFWELRELMARTELVQLRHPAWRGLARWPAFPRRQVFGKRATGTKGGGLPSRLLAWLFFSRRTLESAAMSRAIPREVEVRRWIGINEAV